MLCHSGGPLTPQDRGDGAGNHAGDKEGRSHEGVIVSKDFFSEEKCPSCKGQGRKKTGARSHPRNRGRAMEDMRMVAHDP